MHPSTSFRIQIADFYVEIDGNDNADSAVLQELGRQFLYHKVDGHIPADHRIVVCPVMGFDLPKEAALSWTSACVGGAYQKLSNRSWFVFRKKEIPSYSGVGTVHCYKDQQQAQYFIPELAKWRIKQLAQEHTTYLYIDQYNDKYSVIPFLLHIIGSEYGRYLLFGSTVAINGEALLFIGDSGVGKTPLSMQLIQQGADYMGDDLVLVYLKGDQVMVGSILRPLKCYMNGDYSHKQIVDILSDVSPYPPLNMPLKAVYKLQKYNRWNNRLYLEPMAKDVSFENLMELTNKTYTQSNADHFVDTIYSICTSVPCYYLHGDYHHIKPAFFIYHDKR